MSDDTNELLDLSAMVIAAYVAHNNVARGELTALIANTYAALERLGGAPEAPPAAPLVPAVSIKKSITPDFLFCLDDGKKFKSLKRHLSTLGMTPDQYRAKWSLPADYPMVAPAYAEARSVLAKSIGLGRKPARPAPAAKPAGASRKKVSA